MNAPTSTAEVGLRELARRAELLAEAAIEPEPVATEPPTRATQVIAIYGKGGIGKSFTLANLSYMMAQQGKRVLLIGCDPKSDTTSLLFGGRSCPTIIETSSRKKQAGEAVAIGDVCFKRDGVFAMELGGPEVGRGCGGRGIIHGFELLEKLGFHEWDFDYVLLDFLGDDDALIQTCFPGANYTRDQFTYQLSDHFPVWVQIKTDIDGDRLTQIVQNSKK